MEDNDMTRSEHLSKSEKPSHVCIPRAQHEALMAAAKVIDRIAAYDWFNGPKTAAAAMAMEAQSVRIALRAAGIDPSDGKP